MDDRPRITCRTTDKEILKIDARAKRAGQSRSTFMVRCALAGGQPTARLDPVRALAALDQIRRILEVCAERLADSRGLDAAIILNGLADIEATLSQMAEAITERQR